MLLSPIQKPPEYLFNKIKLMERDIKNGIDTKTQTSKIVEWLEDLKSEDVKRRVISVNKLPEIAMAFGPKKTRDQILPFLNGKINQNLKMMMRKFYLN